MTPRTGFFARLPARTVAGIKHLAAAREQTESEVIMELIAAEFERIGISLDQAQQEQEQQDGSRSVQ